MLSKIKYHAENLNQIFEIEGEEGQFEYLIDYGKKSDCLSNNDKNENNLMSGCLAKVWVKGYKKNDKNYFEGEKVIFNEVFRTLKQSRFCAVNISPVIVARESRSHESKRIPLPFHLIGIFKVLAVKFTKVLIEYCFPVHITKSSGLWCCKIFHIAST